MDVRPQQDVYHPCSTKQKDIMKCIICDQELEPEEDDICNNYQNTQ